MKLFQKLIVAPATLGLLIPSVAFAEEIKLADISNYSSSKEVKSISVFDPAEELAVTNSRIDGLEAKFNDYEAGSFSETTVMSGTAGFLIGATESATPANDKAMMEYFYEVDLNTSFTGEDKLNIEIETGNASGVGVGADKVGLDWGAGNGDVLKVSDINYTFPLGEWKVAVGDSMDASKTWPNACSMNNMVDNLGDCGAANSVDLSGDQSLSAGRSLGDGWEVGLGISANDGETSKGMFTEEGDDYYGVALGYETENYGFTVAYSDKDTATYTGLTAFYSPESTPVTLSGGYELTSPEASGSKDKSQWALGFSTEVGEGTLSLNAGTNGPIVDDAEEIYAYDISYDYPINDSMSITPFVYIAETVSGTDDTTGAGASVSFSF